MKILFVYLVIGLVLGMMIQLFLFSYSYIFNKEINRRKGFLLNLLFSSIIFFITFFKDIVNYPQVYMNNFYFKNHANKIILDFFADNINPAILTMLQIIIISSVFVIILLAALKARNIIFNRIILFLLCISIVLSIVYSLDLDGFDKSDKPNILILASDALRPDHFSGYGYSIDTTPNIDSLINQGVSFRNAYIEVPRTFPSWVSILTGQFASTHGIRHMFPISSDVNRNFETIVRILNDKGYYSSVVADFAGDIFSRIDLGFENLDVPYFNFEFLIEQSILGDHTFLSPLLTNTMGLSLFPVLKDSAYFCPTYFLRERILRSLKKSKGRPFFITTFFSSTHFPYASPYPYYKLYSKNDYKGPYKYFKQRIVSLDSNKEVNLSEEDIEQIRALYDGGLRAFDDEVGRIIKFLSDNDILDNTIIVILSDHGENLYEASLGMGHGEHFRGFYSTRIPLIIRYPKLGLEKRDIFDVVRHVDVAPTLLSILNETIPDHMEGVSLLPLLEGGRADALCAFGETGIWFDNNMRSDLFFQKLRIIYPDIALLSEIDFQLDNQVVVNKNYADTVNLAKHRYIFDGRYKLIYMPLRDRIAYELYDTLRDPGETTNIASIDKSNFHRLKNKLFQWIGRNSDVYIKNDYIYPILRY
ncbi:MAG: sulfatase [Spirochaetota bacterium]|nr:sulfatase [Spirochaetota bacterium]